MSLRGQSLRKADSQVRLTTLRRLTLMSGDICVINPKSKMARRPSGVLIRLPAAVVDPQ